MTTTLALYTTVYPGVEPYLQEWYRSVQDQTDQDFQLWIGLDTLSVDAVREALGADPNATYVAARPADTPSEVRQRALARVVDAHDAVVLVDADDILYPSRVATARAALRESDVASCAIRVVNGQGKDLGLTFALAPSGGVDAVLPRYNIFGLSNSSFRSSVLKRCLPIPAGAVMVDWYLATLAWLLGARFRADTEVGMAYRQYGSNTARVLPPFDADQVTRDTDRVRQHFGRVQSAALPGASLDRRHDIGAAAAEVEAFYRQVVLHPAVFDNYLRHLNTLTPASYWWSCVAHPALRELWAPARSLS